MSARSLPDLDILLAPGAPTGARLLHEPAEVELAALSAHPSAPQGQSSFVRASMIATVDGASWGADGRSGSINGDADYRAFRVMRALADVVLVGAGTARAERYTPLEVPVGLAGTRAAAGLAPALQTAVVTRSGRLPGALLLPTSDAVDGSGTEHPFVVTCAAGRRHLPSSVPAERVLVCGDEQVDLGAALATLAERGLTRVLCEGGPALLGSMIEADLGDELCLTTSPQVLGGPASRSVVTADVLADRPAARLAHLLHADGVLLARWSLRQTHRAPVV